MGCGNAKTIFEERFNSFLAGHFHVNLFTGSWKLVMWETVANFVAVQTEKRPKWANLLQLELRKVLISKYLKLMGNHCC